MLRKNIILILLLGSITSYVVWNKQKKTLVPDKADKILVDKSERKLYLLKKKNILKSYEIALGAAPAGHKQREGDERTPVGIYTIDWRNSKSIAHKSLHISYPNKQDRARAKKAGVSPGGNIMIHGLVPSIGYLSSFHTVYDWTDGCIGVTNDEMDEIWNSVKTGTMIEIRE